MWEFFQHNINCEYKSQEYLHTHAYWEKSHANEGVAVLKSSEMPSKYNSVLVVITYTLIVCVMLSYQLL